MKFRPTYFHDFYQWLNTAWILPSLRTFLRIFACSEIRTDILYLPGVIVGSFKNKNVVGILINLNFHGRISSKILEKYKLNLEVLEIKFGNLSIIVLHRLHSTPQLITLVYDNILKFIWGQAVAVARITQITKPCKRTTTLTLKVR